MAGRRMKLLVLRESEFLGLLRGELRLDPPLPGDARVDGDVRGIPAADCSFPTDDAPLLAARLWCPDFSEVADGEMLPALECRAVPVTPPPAAETAYSVPSVTVKFREFL